MNIKTTDLVEELNANYKIEMGVLNPYQNDLREIIIESEDFSSQYNNDRLILSAETKNQIIKFQQKQNKLFNKIILKINNT